MRLVLVVALDDTDQRCEHLLEELETAAGEHEGVTLKSAGGQFTVDVLQIEEVPA